MNNHPDVKRGKATESWLKFLNPDSLRANLIAASLYLSAYETLRSSFIDQLRSFFINGFEGSNETLSDDYALKVVPLHKSLLRASALWFEQMGAIDAKDLEALESIRQHRNEIAHNLPHLIASAEARINNELFDEIYRLVTKVDRWWITQVELPINPDLCEEDVDVDGIQSGNMIFLQLLTRIASGEPEDASYFYEAFRNRIVKSVSEPA